MPTKLRKLKITRVALCPQGANYDLETGAGAHILLFKAAETAIDKQDVTVGDVYTDIPAGGAQCTDPHCDDPHCPVHGSAVRARRKKKRVTKGPIGAMGMHGEPDGDEAPPLDYATRAHQYDLWEQLWQKWQCLCATYSDVCGDWDADNIPHLPILVTSIEQFRDEVQQLLVDCGVVEKVAPHLSALHGLVTEIAKAGAAMAGHRLTRLKEAITTLQQILEECTPEAIDRPGLSAADVLAMPGIMKRKETSMAVRKNDESDKEHCDHCDDKDCDNPAHDRLKKQEETRMAETLEGVTKRAELAEAQVVKLTARLVELEPLVAKVATLETTITKMQQSPEDQEAEYLATLPEAVRKKWVADQEEKVELRKQLADARDEKLQVQYIAKTADFRHFGMVAKHWKILKAIDLGEGLEVEDREELLRLIKASQEQHRTSGLFTAVGSEGRNGSSGLEGGSASDRLMALTKAYMDEKGVEFIKASEVIAKQHPALYQDSIQERRRHARVSSE